MPGKIIAALFFGYALAVMTYLVYSHFKERK